MFATGGGLFVHMYVYWEGEGGIDNAYEYEMWN